VRDEEQDPDEVLWQAAKIGYDDGVGELAGGVDAWAAAGLPTASVSLTEPPAQPGSLILDIRQDAEFRAGHVPGAVHIELGDLESAAALLPADVPTVVMCGHGERASTGASLLRARGFTRVSVLEGGPQDWVEVTGQELEAGA
jgi:rhodanese-related sulfurtransferase